MGKNEHKLQVRNVSIKRSYCVDRSCKFYGQSAVQGICFSQNASVADWEKIEKMEAELLAKLADLKKRHKGEKLIGWLEAMYVTASISLDFGLDETIRLRRDNALLRLKVKDKK